MARNITGGLHFRARMLGENAALALQILPFSVAYRTLTTQPKTQQNIFVVGGATVDIVASQVKVPRTSNPGRVQQSFGGVGRNIAEGLARLCKGGYYELYGVGFTRVVSHVCQEVLEGFPYRKAILENCAEVGMDVSSIATSAKCRTACFVAMLDGGNDLVAGIADMDICNEIGAHQVKLESSSATAALSNYMVLDGNLTDKALRDLTYHCFERDVPLFYEPVSVAKAVKILPYLHKLNVIKPNLLELLSLYNASYGTDIQAGTSRSMIIEQAQECSKTLLESMNKSGLRAIPVTLGRDGVLCVSCAEEGPIHTEIVAPEKVLASEIVNTTGAGDTFAAGFIWGFWVKQWPLSQVLQVASRAAALSLKSQAAIPADIANAVTPASSEC